AGPVRPGAEDDLHPLLSRGVPAGRGRPRAVPSLPGPAHRGHARAVPGGDPAGLPHEGPVPLPKDRLRTPPDRKPLPPVLPGPALVPDAVPVRLHRGRPGPPFLRKFAVPFWALTEAFGRSPMYWYRLECSLGRSSLVGTTVRSGGRLPQHLVADEKHTTLG